MADELIRVQLLNETEVELLCDAVAGDPDADLARYRAYFGPQLQEWRERR